MEGALSRRELTESFFNGITNHDWDYILGMTTEDFTFWGEVIHGVDRHKWLVFQKALQEAFPDFKYTTTHYREDGDEVFIVCRVTGTHTAPFVFPFGNGFTLKPTNYSFDHPDQEASLRFRGDKICELRNRGSGVGGLTGLLAPLFNLPPVSDDE